MKRFFITLLISIFMISCDTEDDCHEVLSNIVILEIKINDTNGMSLFDNENFEISALRILSLNDNNEEIEYSAFEIGGENIIEFEYFGDIIFNYDGENKADLKFSNIESESNNCGAVTNFSFTAESNDQIICECNSNDIINIEFDI